MSSGGVLSVQTQGQSLIVNITDEDGSAASPITVSGSTVALPYATSVDTDFVIGTDATYTISVTTQGAVAYSKAVPFSGGARQVIRPALTGPQTTIALVRYTPGTLAAQPTAASYGVGLYWASDDNGGTLYRSDGSAWTKQAPGVSQAATPALVVGPATITSNFTTTSTTDVDVTGLTITWTAVAGATYEVWLKGVIGNTTTTATATLALTDSANTVLDTCAWVARSANDSGCIVLTKYVTPGAGSVTYKARLHCSANTGFVLASATFPAQILAKRVA